MISQVLSPCRSGRLKTIESLFNDNNAILEWAPFWTCDNINLLAARCIEESILNITSQHLQVIVYSYEKAKPNAITTDCTSICHASWWILSETLGHTSSFSSKISLNFKNNMTTNFLVNSWRVAIFI